MLVKLLALLGAAIVLYFLVKGHLYVTRKAWAPVFEESEGDTEGGSEPRG